MPAVWAYSIAAPGKTCADARLLWGGTKLQYPEGNDKGQSGWDIGLMFTTFGDLAEKLRVLPMPKDEAITRLAINLHGTPGKIDAGGLAVEADMYDFNKLWNRYSSQLALINLRLADGAVVLIMGCNVAKGDVGAQFLVDLSKFAFPKHKVVGFTKIGETMRQFRSGESCTEPGMRDTPYDNPSEGLPTIKAQREMDTLSLPWASETSPHAKIALNGEIISGAEPAIPTTDYSFNNYLPGSWSITIGDWNGYFVFSRGGDVYWTDSTLRKHPGKWWTMAGCIQWSFSDDAAGWVRIFEILTLLKATLNGKITIKGRDHGFFTMSKQT